MTGVKFLFRVTLRRHDLAAEIYHLKEPQKLPLTMSPDEADRLLAMAGNLKVHVMLALGYGCGLRAGEIVRLKAGDIDSAQMIIRVVQSKGRKDRHVMLPQEVLSVATPMVEGMSDALRRRRAGQGALAISRASAGKASHHATVEPPVPQDNKSGGYQQTRQRAFASSFLRHSSARGGDRHIVTFKPCSVTRSWTRRHAIRASQRVGSRLSIARSQHLRRQRASKRGRSKSAG